MPPSHRQILQASERPAADPHLLVIRELQRPGPREHRRQRDVGDHGAGGEGAGAEMRAGAERDALGRITPHVELIRPLEMALVAIGRAEHQEHALVEARS